MGRAVTFDPQQAIGRPVDDGIFDKIVKAIGIRDPRLLTGFAVGHPSPVTTRLKIKAAHPDLFGSLEGCVLFDRPVLMS